MNHANVSLVALGRILAVALSGLGTANASLAASACEAAKVAASDPGVFDSFGYAVAVSGDTALVGAIWDDDNGTDSGSAYVFGFDGTTWVQTQKLLPSDVQGLGWFGFALATEGGDIAMVSALQHVHDDTFNGSVYVFCHDGANWIEEQELLASDGGPGDGFGFSICISDDVAVIGASRDEDNGPTSGSAYVFRFDGSCWVEEQKLLPSDGAGGDFFGVSVAVSGDVAVIGAEGDDDNGIQSGSAYVFRFDPDTSCWVEEQKLTASDASSHDRFGQSVSVSGEVAVVGALRHDHNGTTDGTAYVFRFDPRGDPGSRWVEEQELLASDLAAADQFGNAVAIDGDTAVIGDSHNDDVGSSFGAAHIFRFVEGRGWVEAQKLLPDPGAWTAFFGFSVALDGDTAVIGAFGEDFQAGSAYVFAGVSGTDCNGNDLSDGCEILDGAVEDANGNGIPDECECPWDLDGSGDVGINDFLALLAAWGPNLGHPADFDGDGDVGITDFLELLANWGACP